MIESLPAWGAWIEILPNVPDFMSAGTSLPAWGAWIEIERMKLHNPMKKSLPAWGAWIEIYAFAHNKQSAQVAPRMGSVD